MDPQTAASFGSGILTYVVPAGRYAHVVEGGVDKVVPGTYAHSVRPDYPAWRWLTAPLEVLWSPASPASG